MRWPRSLPQLSWGVTGFLAIVWLVFGIGYLNDWSGPGFALFACAIGTVFYLPARVVFCHPIQGPGYRMFLQVSPWRAPHPLPLETPYLRAYDVLAMAAIAGSFCLMMWELFRILDNVHWFVAGILAAVGMALRALAIGMIAIRSGPQFAGCFLLWALLAQTAALNSLPQFLAAALATMIAAEFVLRANIAAFPWAGISLRAFFIAPIYKRYWQLCRIADRGGLPFGSIAPHDINPQVSWGEAICIGVTATLFQAALCRFSDLRGFAQVAFSLQFGGVAASRLALYLKLVRMPTSMVARIVRFRWIEPGFDQALAVPILCGVLGMSGLALLPALGISVGVAEAILIGPIWLLALKGPPSYGKWMLVGYHRARHEQPYSSQARSRRGSSGRNHPIPTAGALKTQ